MDPLQQPGDTADTDDQEAQDIIFARALRQALATTAATSRLSAPPPLERLLDLIVRAAARAVPSPEGALFLVDAERRRLVFDKVIGSTAPAVTGSTIPMGHGIAGLVAVSGQPLAVADAQRDPRHARDVAERSGYFPTSILAVPVIGAADSVVGVLELLDRQGQPTYDLADMELLGLFAAQIAIVLEHRRVISTASMLVGQALGLLAGLSPEIANGLVERASGAATAVSGDPVARRTLELAELVADIASRGANEQSTCAAVLNAFATYARSKAAHGHDGEFMY